MTPTQSDREAAAALAYDLPDSFGGNDEAGIRNGAWDDGKLGDIVLAFTRHRLAAEAAAFEKAAGVALREARDEGNGAAVKANAGIIYQEIRKLAGEKHD